MLVGEKVEHASASRPNSFVPGRALPTLLGHHPREESKPLPCAYVMHFGLLRAQCPPTVLSRSDG